MFRFNWLRSLGRGCHEPSRRSRPARVSYRPGFEGLEDRATPAALATIATLGDSLTAAYPAELPWGAAGDQSWAQQLEAQEYRHLAIENVAVPGATSADVLNGQVAVVAQMISTGEVQFATLIVGANDVISDTFLPQIMFGGYEPFVTTVTTNIEAALTQLQDAALEAQQPLGLVVGNIPDVGATPAMQQVLAGLVPAEFLPFVLHNITTAIEEANTEIEAFAAEHGIPVVDMFAFGNLAADTLTQPLHIGGETITNLYSPDFFHPNSVGQGLLANAVLEALATAYAPQLERFSLSDQVILAGAGIAHDPGVSYFDVDPFVIYHREQGQDWSADDFDFGGLGEEDDLISSLASFVPSSGTTATDVLDELFAV